MGRHVHVMLSLDIEQGTGECRNCGPVDLAYRTVKGARVPRCAIAVAAQRDDEHRRYRRTSKRSHGLTFEEARLARQGKACAICGTTENLAVDHCHETTRRRDILCRRHNAGLGMFQDDPEMLEAAAAYVRRWQAAHLAEVS